MSLTKKELWLLIEKVNWAFDHNYNRIQKFFIEKLTDSEQKQLSEFFDQKETDLHNKYKEYWLGSPGIDVSDDGWSDLKAEVIGRGEEFYNNITVEKLVKMAEDNDYEESFAYCFQGLFC